MSGKICRETGTVRRGRGWSNAKTRSTSRKAPAPFPERAGADFFARQRASARRSRFVIEGECSSGCFVSIGSIAARLGYNGMNRACCATGISTTFFDDLDSTNKLAVMKSASENAATNDAHAN
jgi:hypothetical protein